MTRLTLPYVRDRESAAPDGQAVELLEWRCSGCGSHGAVGRPANCNPEVTVQVIRRLHERAAPRSCMGGLDNLFVRAMTPAPRTPRAARRGLPAGVEGGAQ